jgi:DNA topoisomerase-3
MRALLIAEKPSMMRDIKRAYDKKPIADILDFASFRGHVVELFKPQDYDKKYEKWDKADLPIIPSQFRWKNIENCKDITKTLDNLIKSGKYDYIINACDAGREGELIFWAFYKSHGHNLPVKRFWSGNLTEAAIVKALNNLIDASDPSLVGLGKAAEYRAQFDWLCGMNFSRSVSIATNRTVAVGRVMSPVLKMIVDRENAIVNFKPEDYYQVECTLDSHGTEFPALWMAPPDYKDRVSDRKQAEAALAAFKGTARVAEATKKDQVIYAPTLHSLSELQKEANREFGYSIDRTLEIAQKLYEERKLLTYPRTNSRYLPTDMVPEIPNHLRQLTHIPELKKALMTVTKAHIDKVLSTKDYVDNGKITDHHAILVTAEKPDLSILSVEERNIYYLVARRFLSIFLPPYISSNTILKLKSGKNWLKATGKEVIQEGYTELYSIKRKETFLPSLKAGDNVDVIDKKILDKQTQPPKRYTDATILDAMIGAGNAISAKELRKVLKEADGIGTEATRAEIVKKLLAKGYIQREKSCFVPSPLGISIVETIGDRDICSPVLTAIWEKKLREVSEGAFKGNFKDEMNAYVIKETESLLKDIKTNLSQNLKAETVGICPVCKSDVLLGKKFYYCKQYKSACSFIVPKSFLGATITKTDIKTLLAGETTKQKSLTFNDGKTAIKKLVIKDGRLSWEKSSAEPAGICPGCGEKLLQTSKGIFCTNEDCDFLFSKKQDGFELTAEDAIELYKNGSLKNIDLVDDEGATLKADVLYKDKKIKVDVHHVSKKIGTCPLCGSDVVSHHRKFACVSDDCDFIISRVIKRADIAEKDAKALLRGEEVGPLKFYCKDKKWHEASIKFVDGTLEFNWNNKKSA